MHLTKMLLFIPKYGPISIKYVLLTSLALVALTPTQFGRVLMWLTKLT